MSAIVKDASSLHLCARPATAFCLSPTFALCLQPVHLHGSLGREAATGRGTVYATRELLKHSGLGGIANKTYVIQVCLHGDVACGPAAVFQVMQASLDGIADMICVKIMDCIAVHLH